MSSDELQTGTEKRVKELDDGTTFETINAPTPQFIVSEVCGSPDPTYVVDYEAAAEEGKPTAENFHRMMMLEVKLLGLVHDLEGGAEDQLDVVHDELVELREKMLDARGIDDEETRREVSMGNIDVLPEVVRRD